MEEKRWKPGGNRRINVYTHTQTHTPAAAQRPPSDKNFSIIKKELFFLFLVSVPFHEKNRKNECISISCGSNFFFLFLWYRKAPKLPSTGFFFPLSPHTHTHTLLTPIVPERGNFPPVKVPRRSRAMPSSLPATANSFSVAIYYTQGPGTSFLVILPSWVCLSPFLTPLLCNTHTVSQLVIRTVFSSFLCFIEKVSLQNLIYTIMLLTYFELVLFSLVQSYKGRI